MEGHGIAERCEKTVVEIEAALGRESKNGRFFSKGCRQNLRVDLQPHMHMRRAAVEMR